MSKNQEKLPSVSVRLLTDAQHVRDAIAEFDQIGRAEFLKRYGGRKSLVYYINADGRLYDSKPIVASALTRQLAQPLSDPILCSRFSGGDVTVKQVLEELHFVIHEVTPSLPTKRFVPGQRYHRRSDIHDVYGGQERGGICTPGLMPVIFLFTGEAGRAHGYHDHWESDGSTFNFYGEGQGDHDMQLVKGNAAISTHVQTGKSLLLFSAEKTKGYYRYVGEFRCLLVASELQVVAGRKERIVLVFHLTPERLNLTSVEEGEDTTSVSTIELRRRALAAAGAGSRVVSKEAAIQTIRERSRWVRAYALARANGLCEQCGEDAPFSTRQSKPYLEVHHTHRLADDGPDHPGWVAAICPTCHRRIHFGFDGVERNQVLKEKISKLERQIDGERAE